jgi:hypothetical protein
MPTHISSLTRMLLNLTLNFEVDRARHRDDRDAATVTIEARSSPSRVPRALNTRRLWLGIRLGLRVRVGDSDGVTYGPSPQARLSLS